MGYPYVFLWPGQPVNEQRAQDIMQVYVTAMIAARNHRLQEQAEIFVRCGFSPDELEVVTHSDQVDEVLPITVRGGN